MITKEQISQIIAEKVAQDGAYVVDIQVSAANKISVSVDHVQGIPISYCIEISRLIEVHFDREVEDFELEVSSAGLGQPFKVPQQYQKNLGNQVEVITLEGKKLKGELIEASLQGFAMAVLEKVVIEGKKKKELQLKHYMFNFDGVKQVKDIVSFK